MATFALIISLLALAGVVFAIYKVLDFKVPAPPSPHSQGYVNSDDLERAIAESRGDLITNADWNELAPEVLKLKQRMNAQTGDTAGLSEERVKELITESVSGLLKAEDLDEKVKEALGRKNGVRDTLRVVVEAIVNAEAFTDKLKTQVLDDSDATPTSISGPPGPTQVMPPKIEKLIEKLDGRSGRAILGVRALVIYVRHLHEVIKATAQAPLLERKALVAKRAAHFVKATEEAKKQAESHLAELQDRPVADLPDDEDEFYHLVHKQLEALAKNKGLSYKQIGGFIDEQFDAYSTQLRARKAEYEANLQAAATKVKQTREEHLERVRDSNFKSLMKEMRELEHELAAIDDLDKQLDVLEKEMDPTRRRPRRRADKSSSSRKGGTLRPEASNAPPPSDPIPGPPPLPVTVPEPRLAPRTRARLPSPPSSQPTTTASQPHSSVFALNGENDEEIDLVEEDVDPDGEIDLTLLPGFDEALSGFNLDEDDGDDEAIA